MISYSHAIEMDFPYDLLANLLRLRLKLKYSIRPLAHLDRPIGKKVNGVKTIQKILRASPEKKITEIEDLSRKAGIAEVGDALRGIYNSTIRNAVYHSDYAIHDDSLRLLSGTWLSKTQHVYTPVIPFDDLAEITNEAMAFHSALYLLWKRARNSFSDFRGKFLPYDQYYKGIIEFTFEGDTLTGFRTYWPNGTVGVCGRGLDGECYAQNIRFEADGSINFFVGEFASKRSAFSPCVEDGCEPNYAFVPGSEKRPYWPTTLAAYEL